MRLVLELNNHIFAMLNVVSVVKLVSVSQYLKWVTVRVLGEKIRYLLTHLRRRHVPDIVLGSNY